MKRVSSINKIKIYLHINMGFPLIDSFPVKHNTVSLGNHEGNPRQTGAVFKQNINPNEPISGLRSISLEVPGVRA